MIFVLCRATLRLFRDAKRFCSAQRFSCNEQESLRPIFPQRYMNQTRVPRTQLPKLTRVRRQTENHCGRRLKGTQDPGQSSFHQRADYYQIVRRRFLVFPEFGAEDGNPRGLPFGLPTSGQQPCEFRFIGQD